MSRGKLVHARILPDSRTVRVVKHGDGTYQASIVSPEGSEGLGFTMPLTYPGDYDAAAAEYARQIMENTP